MGIDTTKQIIEAAKPLHKYRRCNNCKHSEICRDDMERRHCNIHDKSYDSGYYCDEFEGNSNAN